MGPCSGSSLCTLTRTGSTRTQRSRSKPIKGHSTIYTQIIGSFGEAEAEKGQYVRWLRDYCQAFYYRLVVKLLPPVTVAATGGAFRVNSSSRNLQIHAGDLLQFLQKRKP